jgi:hypothetical protein
MELLPCCSAYIVGPLAVELLLLTASIWRLKSFNCWPERAVADREGRSSLHTSTSLRQQQSAGDSRCRPWREQREHVGSSPRHLQHPNTIGQISNQADRGISHPSRHQDEAESKDTKLARNPQVGQRLGTQELQSGLSCASTAPRRHGRPEAEAQHRAACHPVPHPRCHDHT